MIPRLVSFVIPVLARRSASARRRANGKPDAVPAKAGSQIDVMDSPHQVRGRLCWRLPLRRQGQE